MPFDEIAKGSAADWLQHARSDLAIAEAGQDERDAKDDHHAGEITAGGRQRILRRPGRRTPGPSFRRRRRL